LLDKERNQGIQEYLSKLSVTSETTYSLRKATKRLKRSQTYHPPIRNGSSQDGSWARSEKEKAETFTNHLFKIFKPNPREIIEEEENKLLSRFLSHRILRALQGSLLSMK